MSTKIKPNVIAKWNNHGVYFFSTDALQLPVYFFSTDAMQLPVHKIHFL
jgi:hypothetical protein